MRLDQLRVRGRRPKKRVGRGNASGHGTYSGRGIKGQRARAGARIRPGFEGGQTPLFRRFPKRRGFRSLRPPVVPVNVGILERRFPAGSRVDLGTLRKAGLIPERATAVKILGDGTLTKALAVALPTSKQARAKIEQAGGTVEERGKAAV